MGGKDAISEYIYYCSFSNNCSTLMSQIIVQYTLEVTRGSMELRQCFNYARLQCTCTRAFQQDSYQSFTLHSAVTGHIRSDETKSRELIISFHDTASPQHLSFRKYIFTLH